MPGNWPGQHLLYHGWDAAPSRVLRPCPLTDGFGSFPCLAGAAKPCPTSWRHQHWKGAPPQPTPRGVCREPSASTKTYRSTPPPASPKAQNAQDQFFFCTLQGPSLCQHHPFSSLFIAPFLYQFLLLQ